MQRRRECVWAHRRPCHLLLQRRIAAPQPAASHHLVPPAVRLVAQQRRHLSPLPEPPEDALHLLRMLAQLPLPPKEPQHALPQRVSIFLVVAGRHGRIHERIEKVAVKVELEQRRASVFGAGGGSEDADAPVEHPGMSASGDDTTLLPESEPELSS